MANHGVLPTQQFVHTGSQALTESPEKKELIHKKKESIKGPAIETSLPPPSDHPLQKKSQIPTESTGHVLTTSSVKTNTGLPDHLKTGMKNLSGMPLDDLKVHRNSDKPAQLQAHAYAQGTDIHLGPGQEKHLPHEAWHVVQQVQGRMKPTMQMKGSISVNDEERLVHQALSKLPLRGRYFFCAEEAKVRDFSRS